MLEKKIHTWSDLLAAILFDRFSKMLNKHSRENACVRMCVSHWVCSRLGKGSKMFASTVVLVASSSSKDGCVSDQ